jgi:predicted  nucleic acid-binding Zn-ribbon protein
MAAKDQKKDATKEAAAEVGRIRDIIFGNEMRDYDRRFDSLQGDLDRLQQEIDRLRSQQVEGESSVNSRVQTVRDEARKADDAIRAELRETATRLGEDKVGRAQLAALLEAMAGALRSGEDDGPDGLMARLAEAQNGIEGDR